MHRLTLRVKRLTLGAILVDAQGSERSRVTSIAIGGGRLVLTNSNLE
jgi:hypothetical protein